MATRRVESASIPANTKFFVDDGEIEDALFLLDRASILALAVVKRASAEEINVAYHQFKLDGQTANEQLLRAVESFGTFVPTRERLRVAEDLTGWIAAVAEWLRRAIDRRALDTKQHAKLRKQGLALASRLRLLRTIQVERMAVAKQRPPASPVRFGFGFGVQKRTTKRRKTVRLRNQSAPIPPAAEDNRRIAKTADEAVAALGDEWATVAQLSKVTGLSESAIRSRIKRAKDKGGVLSTDEQDIRDSRPGTARLRYRIRSVWDRLSIARERSVRPSKS